MQQVFLWLLFFHFLFDYPLQGDFLSKAKNRSNPIPGIPWWQALGAHSFMHAMGVFIVTGYWFLFVVEFVVHYITDDLKCTNKLTFNQDQFIHVLCKVIYAFIVIYLMGPSLPIGNPADVWLV